MQEKIAQNLFWKPKIVQERQQMKAQFTDSKNVLNKKWALVYKLRTCEEQVRQIKLWQQYANKQSAFKKRYWKHLNLSLVAIVGS